MVLTMAKVIGLRDKLNIQNKSTFNPVRWGLTGDKKVQDRRNGIESTKQAYCYV